MENGDKLGEVSIMFPLWQWSIFQAGLYWKPLIPLAGPIMNTIEAIDKKVKSSVDKRRGLQHIIKKHATSELSKDAC